MAKAKMGRPPRAKGEKMQRISVVVRQRYREALDLIARDRRTSASQALEFIMTTAAKEYEIDGVPLLATADQLASVEDGPAGDLQRAVLIPSSLRTPLETFTVEVLALLGDGPSVESASEAELLVQVIADVAMSNNDPAFAISVWRRACEGLQAGEQVFTVEDSDGLTYEYELKVNKPSVAFDTAKMQEALTRAFVAVGLRNSYIESLSPKNLGHQGSGPHHLNPTPRGPVPKGRKKPTAK